MMRYTHVVKRIIALIGISAIIAWSGWRLWYALALRAVDAASDARVSITIEPGTSTQGIASLLEEKGVIRSSYAFIIFASRAKKASALQAGTFVLQPSMPTADIVDALTSGQRQQEEVLTIPEGYTVKDIDALLADKGFIDAGAFVACANSCDFSTFDFVPTGSTLAQRGGKIEGYLYPDTYFVAREDFDPASFSQRLLGTFRTRVIDAYSAEIKASGRSLHEILTMASLVEEEARTDDERAVVAGILWKRFDEGMGLYVDASNRYIANKPVEALTRADLDMDTPYNLRKYRGLPPGPIANPSLSSIEATLNPRTSPYYYYLHDAQGAIHYAVTNDEHNANKARYLQ